MQELRLAETREYNKVLVFMEKRLQKQQVTFEGTLQAYEEALKLRRDELNDSARLLFEVRKEKQSEDHALVRYQVRLPVHSSFLSSGGDVEAEEVGCQWLFAPHCMMLWLTGVGEPPTDRHGRKA